MQSFETLRNRLITDTLVFAKLAYAPWRVNFSEALEDVPRALSIARRIGDPRQQQTLPPLPLNANNLLHAVGSGEPFSLLLLSRGTENVVTIPVPFSVIDFSAHPKYIDINKSEPIPLEIPIPQNDKSEPNYLTAYTQAVAFLDNIPESDVQGAAIIVGSEVKVADKPTILIGGLCYSFGTNPLRIFTLQEAMRETHLT